jgi:hypothetical protein
MIFDKMGHERWLTHGVMHTASICMMDASYAVAGPSVRGRKPTIDRPSKSTTQ